MNYGKPLYQPWNEEEFQSDVFVRGMTYIQKWMYRSLLQASFFHTTRPYLPDDDRILWILAGCESNQQWLDHKSEVMERFTPVLEQPGLLENKRVSKDWNKLVEQREEMSELGKRRSETAKRTETGQFLSSRVLLTSDSPATAGLPTSDEPAREDKVREGKISEDKVPGEPHVFPPSQTWKELAIKHKRFFGKQAGQNFKERFFELCSKYTAEIVMECFETWAADNAAWLKEKNFNQPLTLFFKNLPGLADDCVAIRADDKRVELEQEQVERAKSEMAAATEVYVAEQKAAEVARWFAPDPQEPGMPIEDFMRQNEELRQRFEAEERAEREKVLNGQ